MRIHGNKPLFAWDCLEDSPTLQTIRELLEVLPDEDLVASLEAARGKGRDDYPVRTLWGAIVLAVALRHPTLEHCLGELRRNESLRRLIGIESEETVPQAWNLSRFLDSLGRSPHRGLLHEVFNQMARWIETLAYDKAADTHDVHQLLSNANIKPVIANRSLWKEEPERMLPGHDGNSNLVYDEAGTVYCHDHGSNPSVRHQMSYIGHEPARETLKDRCPAMHEGWSCPMAERCNAGKT